MSDIKQIFVNPLFLVGVVLRLAIVLVLTPASISIWFAPFLDITTQGVFLDPWTAWIDAKGDSIAFPYGYAMWLSLLPFVLLSKLVGLPVQYGYQLTIFCADFALLYLLSLFEPGRQRLLLLVYWLSPIIILASYVLGLNDLIPVLYLMTSIYFVKCLKFRYAGVFCAVAISTKLSMVVAFPFFLIYFLNNRALRRGLNQFLLGLLAAILVLGVPFIFSTSGVRMLLGNPELAKVFDLSIDLNHNFSIYLLPLVYTLMLYQAWRVRRMNFELFEATIGMIFLLIVLMTPASPGWFVWCLPFLVLYQAMSGRIAIGLCTLFSILYIFSTLTQASLVFFGGAAYKLSLASFLPQSIDQYISSLLYTMITAAGILLAIRIWRESVSRNDYFRLSRKPFIIGVAGDSGAGKDTYVDSLTGLFGAHSVAKLSGDDYHLWDRQKPMWQVMTHLNPMANDLERFSSDILSLADGRSIQSRHYDHQTGKMTKPMTIYSNDLIIASGLHALYLPNIRECYDLKVFLDADEDLRRYLKIQRDVHQRGHSLDRVLASFQRREPDAERFIRPQAMHADLILSLQPMHPDILKGIDESHPLRLKLIATTRYSFSELSLNRVLVGICGLHVDINVEKDGHEVKIAIEGETSAADIAQAASLLCPRSLEFLDLTPQWLNGVSGLMQLITLLHINQALTKRMI